MFYDRRTILSAIGLFLPLGIRASGRTVVRPPTIVFQNFEDVLREVFADVLRSEKSGSISNAGVVRQVLIGHSELVQRGLQGFHNDRPFAGFQVGDLRIVRSCFEAGPTLNGVRLYLAKLDILYQGCENVDPIQNLRSLDFSAIPPAPILCDEGLILEEGTRGRPTSRSTPFKTSGGHAEQSSSRLAKIKN